MDPKSSRDVLSWAKGYLPIAEVLNLTIALAEFFPLNLIIVDAMLTFA